MTKRTVDRPAYQEQSARMTQLGRKVMYNELQRLAKLRGQIHDNRDPAYVAGRPTARMVTKTT